MRAPSSRSYIPEKESLYNFEKTIVGLTAENTRSRQVATSFPAKAIVAAHAPAPKKHWLPLGFRCIMENSMDSLFSHFFLKLKGIEQFLRLVVCLTIYLHLEKEGEAYVIITHSKIRL